MKTLLVHASRENQLLAKTLMTFTGESGLYSSVVPTEQTRELILSLCARLGLPVTEADEFHSTIIFSPDVCPNKDTVTRNLSHQVVSAQAVGFEQFGKDGEDLVLTLSSPDMAQIHFKWKALGAKPTWPDYRAHVTLAKDTKVEPEIVEQCTAWILNNRLPPLEFYPEQVEDILPKYAKD